MSSRSRPDRVYGLGFGRILPFERGANERTRRQHEARATRATHPLSTQITSPARPPASPDLHTQLVPPLVVPIWSCKLTDGLVVCSARFRAAWANKRPSARWVPIPLGLGALVVGALEYQKNWNGSRRRDRADVGMAEDGDEMIVRVRGPWQVSTQLQMTITLMS